MIAHKKEETAFREISVNDTEYPESLRRIHDPPKKLYAIGQRLFNDRPRVAIVGARKCTAYGRSIAKELAAELAGAGIDIVSGLALGIDAAAHSGALINGSTIAILGCGIDKVYPLTNKQLYGRVIKTGTVLSEYPPGTLPLAHNFPARNRIVSGMSIGVIVVEAGNKSGALITADFALEQGREVMAIPGHVKNPASWGCHELIKAGAALVIGAKDVLEILDLEKTGSAHSKKKLSPEENAILQSLGFEPAYIDQLALRMGVTPASLAGPLIGLEINGYVRKDIGGSIIRIK